MNDQDDRAHSQLSSACCSVVILISDRCCIYNFSGALLFVTLMFVMFYTGFNLLPVTSLTSPLLACMAAVKVGMDACLDMPSQLPGEAS